MQDEYEALVREAELAEFYEWASSLRLLWHWISLLIESPETKVYFHEWLQEEIPIEDGRVFCPGTITTGYFLPKFQNATTPNELALEMAIFQCEHVYFSSIDEPTIDNVDRLSVTLPHCKEYCSKIRTAVGQAKSRSYRAPDRNRTEAISKRAIAFRQCWQAVYNLIMELFFIVDVEFNTRKFETDLYKQPRQQQAKVDEPTKPSKKAGRPKADWTQEDKKIIELSRQGMKPLEIASKLGLSNLETPKRIRALKRRIKDGNPPR
jgi:hypothetical protein